MLLPSTGFTCGTFCSNERDVHQGDDDDRPGNIRGIEFLYELFERNDGRILGAMRTGHQGESRPGLRAANYRNRDIVPASLPAETSMNPVTVCPVTAVAVPTVSAGCCAVAATPRKQLRRINAKSY
jgi:hypothetical protein